MGGGSSNWWGGKCSRFSEHVFQSRDFLPWVFTRSEMDHWYGLAERRLNVSGDPLWGEGEPVNAMPGAAYWRDAYSPYLSPTHIYNVAINRGPEGAFGQGSCKGTDFRLIGTDNVFCAVASIIPRAGGVAPTLTIVALAEMLAEQLL